jgi:hypothetical protein
MEENNMDNTIKYTETEKLTFEEWENIHNAIKTEEKKEAVYYLKQKLSGLIVLSIGIITPILTKDLTPSLFCLPLGVGLIATKEKVMDFRQ